MKDEIKFSGQLKALMHWPWVLAGVWVLMAMVMFMIDVRAGLLGIAFLVVYLGIVAVIYTKSRKNLMTEMISFAASYGQIQKELLKDFLLPYAILDCDGKILWMNQRFMELTQKNQSYHKSIKALMPEISERQLPGTRNNTETNVHYNDKDYLAAMHKISMDSLLDEESVMSVPAEKNYLIALYLFDTTELNQLKLEKEQEKLVCGIIYLDNYEEALESVEEVRRSLLVALVDRKISKYFSEHDAVVRKLEKDKYFMVMRKRSLEALQANKFSILEEVKTVNVGNEMAVTLSIGIGLNGSSYNQNADYSRVAIEMALGRGGDQVVVKNGKNTTYFGGKTESVDKNTRVKARVKAHALKEFMLAKDRVVVMGHKIPDVDVLGAAIGIYRAAKLVNKPAYIVMDSPPKSLQPLMARFKEHPDYEGKIFITSREAKELVDRNTMVVVVDTNKPNYTECEELLSMTPTIVVLDHHRQGRDIIRNAVLSYIEPYASSACEMVAEVLQYFLEGVRIRNIEADCMYAGIMVDTNNFLTRTGVRTFEAAAYLRRCGADVTRVRKMFRDSMGDYRAKAETIANAETFEECFAIAICPSDGLDNPTIIGAQAANDLLNVVGIKASFVLTEYNGTIYVSARAIDEMNVQVIMERLGGGGHLNMAGAQFQHLGISEAVHLLKATLREMIEDKEL